VRYILLPQRPGPSRRHPVLYALLSLFAA
jgi:hypothetical protein